MPDDDLRELLDGCTPEEEAALRQLAREESWRVGDLSYKLHDDQLRVYAEITERGASREVLEISRRWGKTYLLVVMVAELCLRNPRKRVVYGAPTLKHLEEFIIPALEQIAEDAPDDVRPVYEPSTGHWRFQNGAYVHLFGADDKRKADRGRGPEAIACVFDEAGFTPVLRYVMRSVFRPQTLHTGGPTILASTPAEEPDHDFTQIAEVAEANGSYTRRTIHDNPRLTPERIAEFIAEDAKDEGMTVEEYQRTDTFRREFLAERVTDKTLQVMGGDWQAMRDAAFIEVPRPQFFDGYEVIDYGGADPRAAVFGFYDFANARLVIEDEVNLRNNENTAELADAIKAKERALWGVEKWQGSLKAVHVEELDERLEAFLSRDEVRRIKKELAAPAQPYLRLGDHDTQSCIDLHTMHGLTVVPAEKGELVLAVNEFRVAVRMGRVVINPRCRDLDRQMRTGEWTSPRATDFKRKNGEHLDVFWCAIRMWQNVRKTRNPVPVNFGVTDPVDLARRRAAQARNNPWRKIAGR